MIKRWQMDKLKLQTVYARNCEVRRIDKAQAADFIGRFHRMGYTTGRYHYALFVKRRTGASEAGLDAGTMVAAASFSQARKWLKNGREVRSYEWVRYCSLPDLRVVGGMGKILEEFITCVRPDDVMTYSDPRWSDGDAYKALGFVPEGEKDFGTYKSVKMRLKLTDYE